MNITAEQVKQEVENRKITQWKLRECSMCNYPLCYVFESGRVFYDVGCNCTRGRGGLEERTYQSVAEVFNMQNDEIGTRMWDDFINQGTTV